MKRSFVLSIAAGLVGGALSTYLRPPAAHAQSQPLEELRAQRFTLVSEKGAVLGSFSLDSQGRPQIMLCDVHGHLVWSVVGEHGPSFNRVDRK